MKKQYPFVIFGMVFLWLACATEIVGIEPPNGRFEPGIEPGARLFFPVGLAVHPNGRYLYVVNTNFDLHYNGGAVMIIDIETRDIIFGNTVKIGSLGGKLILNSTGDFGFVTDRETSTLTFFQLLNEGAEIFCSHDIEDLAPEQLYYCSNAYKIPLAPDPFGLAMEEFADGSGGRLFVSHIMGGEVSYLIFNPIGIPVFQNILFLQAGSDGLGISRHNGYVYVTNQFDQFVRYFYVDGSEFRYNPALDFITVDNDSVNLGLDTRDVAFSSDGRFAYILSRSPNSLLVVDISINPEGGVKNQIVDVVQLGEMPSFIYVYPDPLQGDMIYVTSYFMDRIIVIKADMLNFYDMIETQYGPAVFVAHQPTQRGFVTNFEDHSVSAIDLNPSSFNYHKVIFTVR